MRQLEKYNVLALSILFIYVCFHGLKLDQNIHLIQSLMLLVTIILVASFLFHSKKTKFQFANLNFLIILLGFLMRIGYMLYTSCLLRCHDFGDLSLENFGHSNYILELLINKRLPNSNTIQFYHPPLFHILGATVSTIANAILGSTNYYDLVDATKIVSCFASCGTLLISSQLCDTFHLKALNKSLVMALLAFFPNFYLLAGRVNNDSLSIFFMSAAILYTYRWYENQSFKNTCLLALIFGLGMMTKTSCAVMAIFTFIVMCYVLYQRLKEKQAMKLLLKLCCFAFISFPLGLWYPLRNYLLFKQPLGYVLEIPKELDIFCGDIPFFQRFISFNLSNLLATPFASPWEDYNIPTYLLKTSLFGEFSYEIPYFLPVILLLLNLILILCSLISMYLLIMNRTYAKSIRYGLPSLWLIFMVSYIYFNIRYPFGCTMDFRYIVPTVILGALFIGLSYTSEPVELIKTHPILHTCHKIYYSILPYIIILFMLFSFLMFLLIAK